MAWQTMTDLSSGDVVTATDMDAIRLNIEELAHLASKPAYYSFGAYRELFSTASYVQASGLQEANLIPDDIAARGKVYFEALIKNPHASETTYCQLYVNGVAVTGAEVSFGGSVAYSAVRSGDISANLSGATEVTFTIYGKITPDSTGSTAEILGWRLIIEPD